MVRKAKSIERMVKRSRDKVKGYKVTVPFPDLSIISQAAPLSNTILSPLGRKDLLTDHLWRKDSKDKAYAVEAAYKKRRLIGPQGHKQGDSYLGESFVDSVKEAKRRP